MGQLDALAQGADIVAATPGRLADLVNTRACSTLTFVGWTRHYFAARLPFSYPR